MSKSEAVEILCILDRSGSMGFLAEEVINSFNQFIEDQKKEEGKARVTLVLFDNNYEKVYESVKLKKVPELTSKTYFARGLTSLYDAIGKTITDCDAKDAMVLIQTDGFENSSQEFNQTSVKKLIKEKEALGWDFIFLGANIDTVAVGTGFGMAASKSVSYANSTDGVKGAFMNMSAVTSDYRKTKLSKTPKL